MDKKHKMIFRYDNAPHHPGVASYPHHKPEFLQVSQLILLKVTAVNKL